MWSAQKVSLLFGRDVVATERFVTIGSRCGRHGSICYCFAAMLHAQKDLLRVGRDVVATLGMCYYWVAMWSPQKGLLALGCDVVDTGGFVTIGPRCGRHIRICYCWVAMWSSLIVLGVVQSGATHVRAAETRVEHAISEKQPYTHARVLMCMRACIHGRTCIVCVCVHSLVGCSCTPALADLRIVKQTRFICVRFRLHRLQALLLPTLYGGAAECGLR